MGGVMPSNEDKSETLKWEIEKLEGELGMT